MKSNAKTIVKFLCLSFVLSFFIFGSYAQNKYSNPSAENTHVSKPEDLPENDIKSQEDLSIVEKNIRPESYISDSTSGEITKQLEWNDETVEESNEVEDTMNKFELQKGVCITTYTNLVEKEWMKDHDFFIL